MVTYMALIVTISALAGVTCAVLAVWDFIRRRREEIASRDLAHVHGAWHCQGNAEKYERRVNQEKTKPLLTVPTHPRKDRLKDSQAPARPRKHRC